MYTQNKMAKTSLKVNAGYPAESLEKKIARMMQNSEPIGETAPLIYQERHDGIQPDYDIRTDRFEAAIDAMDYVSKTHRAKRDGKPKADQKKNDGEPESSQATGNEGQPT